MTPEVSPRTWVFALLISVLLCVGLVLLAEPGRFPVLLAQLKPGLLVAACLLLTLEALCASYRIALCSLGRAAFLTGAYTNAWYVLWLNVLPARLGEVVGVRLFQNLLEMPLGAAISSLVVQRLLDILVLCGLFSCLLVASLADATGTLLGVLSIMLALVMLIQGLPFLLRLLAACLARQRWRESAKALLQGRRWMLASRHVQNRAILVTLGKWLANILAITLVLSALPLQLPIGQLLISAVAVNFLAAVPLQSLGGIGVVEAGLTGILVGFGADTTSAVTASFVLRLVTLVYVGFYFLVSMLVLRGVQRG